jgi:hypothetical protein
MLLQMNQTIRISRVRQLWKALGLSTHIHILAKGLFTRNTKVCCMAQYLVTQHKFGRTTQIERLQFRLYDTNLVAWRKISVLCKQTYIKIANSAKTIAWVDVTITIFCDFRPFSAEKMAFFSKTYVIIKFLHNLALFWAQNANFFAEFFGENI